MHDSVITHAMCIKPLMLTMLYIVNWYAVSLKQFDKMFKYKMVNQ